jgi:hypothetical protein
MSYNEVCAGCKYRDTDLVGAPSAEHWQDKCWDCLAIVGGVLQEAKCNYEPEDEEDK